MELQHFMQAYKDQERVSVEANLYILQVQKSSKRIEICWHVGKGIQFHWSETIEWLKEISNFIAINQNSLVIHELYQGITCSWVKKCIQDEPAFEQIRYLDVRNSKEKNYQNI